MVPYGTLWSRSVDAHPCRRCPGNGTERFLTEERYDNLTSFGDEHDEKLGRKLGKRARDQFLFLTLSGVFPFLLTSWKRPRRR